MTIKIICVGKLKEKYLKEAIKEYTKRLSRFTKINIIQVQDERDELPNSKELEGEKILKYIKDNEYVITLEIEGKQITSEQLGQKINSLMISGNSNITFVIGGSNGLSEDVLKVSNYALSFSKMTFPHQLMRVILLEQIYRAFKIINDETYHK